MTHSVFAGLRKFVEELHAEAVGKKPEAPTAFELQRWPGTCWDDHKIWLRESARFKPQLDMRLSLISAWEKEAKNLKVKRSVQSMTDALLAVPVENPESYYDRTRNSARKNLKEHAKRLQKAWKAGMGAVDECARPIPPDFEKMARNGTTESEAWQRGGNAARDYSKKPGLG